jgi:transcriptional regulator with XRE-family HTH domain
MGTSRRIRPVRLAEKLTTIRTKLGLTTEDMIRALDCSSVPLYRATITQYEKDRREPPLIVLLRYAQLGRIPVDTLIDDDVDLP